MAAACPSHGSKQRIEAAFDANRTLNDGPDRPSGGTHFPTCATSAAAVSDRASDGCCECCVGGLAKTEPKENVIVPAPGSSEDVDLLEKGLGCTLPE